MGFSPQQQTFINTLSSSTGLNPGVVAAWVAAEEPVGATSGFHGTQDWLNVGITDSGPMGAGNSVWQDPRQAAISTANWIKGTWSDPGFGTAAPTIQAILHTVGQSPQAQLSAIQNSHWASSGYPDLPQLFSQYGSYRLPPGSATPSITAPQSAPSQPGMSSQQLPQSVTLSTFNKQAFTQANDRYIAGQFLQGGSGPNPFDVGPKVDVGGLNGVSNNELLSPGLLGGTAPNPADFNVSKTFQLAQNSLQQIAGKTPLNTHQASTPGFNGYVNPFGKAQGLVPERVDMGQDFSMQAGSPILAIGDSKLVQVLGNWYAGQPLLLFQFMNGPKAGQYWYVSEQINPKTTQIGSVFHAGDPVATFASSGTGIEMGYGSPTSNSRTLAGQEGNTGDASHGNSPAGIAFSQFLHSLGVP